MRINRAAAKLDAAVLWVRSPSRLSPLSTLRAVPEAAGLGRHLRCVLPCAAQATRGALRQGTRGIDEHDRCGGHHRRAVRAHCDGVHRRSEANVRIIDLRPAAARPRAGAAGAGLAQRSGSAVISVSSVSKGHRASPAGDRRRRPRGASRCTWWSTVAHAVALFFLFRDGDATWVGCAACSFAPSCREGRIRETRSD